MNTPKDFTDADFVKALKRGSNVVNSKFRIAAFYAKDPTPAEAQDFLKQEYGIGGSSHDFSDGTHGFIDYDGKGIRLSRFKDHDHDKLYKWREVEARLRRLIMDGDYLTPEEQAKYDMVNSKKPDAPHDEPEESADDTPDDDMPDFIPRSEAEILARTLEIDEFQALAEYRCARDESPTPNAEGVYVGDLFSLRARDGSCTFFQVMELNGEHGIIVRENAQMRQPYENGYYGVCRPVRDSFVSDELHALTTRRSQYWSYVFTKAPKSFGSACMTPCNDLQLFDYVVSEK